MSPVTRIARRGLLPGASALAAIWATPALALPPFLHLGSPVIDFAAGVPLSAPINTTTAATAFLASCSTLGDGPSYPQPWVFDPAKITGVQPQGATDAMGLTPLIEQVRGGTVIATWGQFHINGTTGCAVTNRSDVGPITSGPSLACGGPFGQISQVAWQENDTFLVHPAVYKEAIYLAPVSKLSTTANLTSGSQIVTLASTHDLLPGDAFYDDLAKPPTVSPYVSRLTHIQSVDSSTQITLDKPLLGTIAARPINITKNASGVTIQGLTENVPGFGNVRPTVAYDTSADLTQSARAMLQIHTDAFYDSDISNILIDNLDFTVIPPPYGQRSYSFPNDPSGLIYLSGIEVTGPVTFSNIRVNGAAYINVPGGGMGMWGTVPGSIRSNTGTVTVDRSEFFNNGGTAGPAHHLYLDSGNNQVRITNSYFHHVVNGHLIKLRGKDNYIVGNLLDGSGFGPFTKAGLSNNANTPCGGSVTMRDNILLRRSPLTPSNTAYLSYYEDRQCATDFGGYFTWAQMENGHIDIENNSFGSLAKRDTGGPLGNPNMPFYFSSKGPPSSYSGSVRPQSLPGDAASLAGAGVPTFPTTDVTIKNNFYAGFCTSGNRFSDFPWATNSPNPVGPNLNADFSEVDQRYAPQTNWVPAGDTSILGWLAYAHNAQPGPVRAKATFGAEDQDSTATPAPAAVPSVLLYADAYQLGNGNSTNLHWATTGTTGANPCTASGGWSGAKASSGVFSISPPDSVETTYAITCTGATGTAASSVSIQMIGPQSFTFTSDTATTAGPGQPVNFFWTSTNADSCLFSDAIQQGQIAAGSLAAFPAQTITYSLGCPGAFTQFPTRQHIKITVGSTLELPTVYFWASPSTDSVSGGTFGTLNWESNGTTGGTPCTGTGAGFAGAQAASGTLNLQPSARVDFTLSCTGPGGTSATRTTTIFGAP